MNIKYAMAIEGYHKENWEKMIEWLVDHMTRFEIALKKPLEKLNQELKAF